MIRRKYNTRGPRSKAPGGYGSLDVKGYRRLWTPKQNKLRLEHVLKWEARNGKLPKGYHIHHKDKNKLNNHLSNLHAVSNSEHNRKHRGCVLRNRHWYKRCSRCHELKPLSSFYKNKRDKRQRTWCRDCMIYTHSPSFMKSRF